jgi:hypothetical protein
MIRPFLPRRRPAAGNVQRLPAADVAAEAHRELACSSAMAGKQEILD